jgi:hypothetical protein
VLQRRAEDDAAGSPARGRGADQPEQHFGPAFADEDLPVRRVEEGRASALALAMTSISARAAALSRP